MKASCDSQLQAGSIRMLPAEIYSCRFFILFFA